MNVVNVVTVATVATVWNVWNVWNVFVVLVVVVAVQVGVVLVFTRQVNTAKIEKSRQIPSQTNMDNEKHKKTAGNMKKC